VSIGRWAGAHGIVEDKPFLPPPDAAGKVLIEAIRGGKRVEAAAGSRP
jgi:hypothetical protein